jgi:hypothetical protein
MKIKTSELSGVALDWAVFYVEQEALDWYINDDGHFMAEDGEVSWKYQPSTDWRRGGAIIERERLQISPQSYSGNWGCNKWNDGFVHSQYGETPLIAAMRCYVFYKLGKRVEVPDEVA